MQTPTPGRIVSFKPTNRDTVPVPAMILAVHDDNVVDLNIFKPGIVEYQRNASMAESFGKAEAGQWAWPERV